MMTTPFLEKNITILGAKRSGLALVDLVLRIHAVPRVSERAQDADMAALLGQKGIECEFGGHTQSFIEKSDLVILSPGVPIDGEAACWAKNRNIPVLGEIEFAFQFCPIPVIAVTGSNGKTTVVTLIHEILKEAGHPNCLCGNVGYPFSGYCLDLSSKDYVVLEISSFQLESVLGPDSNKNEMAGLTPFSFKRFRPFISVFLNFSQNHLDRHKDIEEYFEAKKRIFINQTKDDYAVFSDRCDMIKKDVSQMKAQVSCFDDDMAKRRYQANNLNQMAVLEVARILKIDPQVCSRVFKRFKGVEHRLEWVRNVRGVDYFNDSKATTAEAGRWALNNFEKPVVMICGGRDKNIDFSVLKDLVKKKVKKMIVIGEAKKKLRETFEDVVTVEESALLEEAVHKASQSARQGGAVLLSPMCASFDMFNNFEERGRAFKEIVNQLK